MATEQEKQELVDILKFEPIPVRVFITGRGGESYASVVDRKVYEYFKGRKLDIEQYADDYDNEYEVPKELQPFEPGNPYDCDNLWHVSGASIDDAVISIKNAITGELIWSCFADFASLVTAEVNINEVDCYELDCLDDGTVVFWGGQGDKGCFFEAEYTLTSPFNPKNLEVMYEDCNGWQIITGLEYDGAELDGNSNWDTDGKWAEHKWIILGDEEVYEVEDD